MKRMPFFAVLFALASVVIAAGQAPATEKPAASAAVPAKVAVIAFQAAVTQTNEFQRSFADLQKKYDPKRAELKSLSDEIDTLTKQLEAQGPQLTDAERVSRSRAIEEKKKQLDRDSQDDQSDYQADVQQLLNDMAAKVGAVMTDYAQKHGYTLVLDAGSQQDTTVLYAVPSTDITKAVIEAYNLKSGIPAPPPSQGASQPILDAPQPQPAAH